MTFRFNEAAGIHRRKPSIIRSMLSSVVTCFNEAAGIHRRKHRRDVFAACPVEVASMRPPEFTGGNPKPTATPPTTRWPLQ